MATMGATATDLLTQVRRLVAAQSAGAEVRRPFRFFLCGDPALISELRATLLWGHEDDFVPLDAAATLETIDPTRHATLVGSDARCVIFLGRAGDAAGARLDLLAKLGLPLFVVTVDPTADPEIPLIAPVAGKQGDYVVPSLDRDGLRGRLFPHLIDCCKGVEVPVGRRLPALREAVAAKLTRDAASNALKIAAASAIIDNVPVLGLVLGAVASAGDMVAITAIQVSLLMNIGTAYGKDPDMASVWEMLPIVGGGLGWRALARELSGFIPVAGIAVKGGIAYAGTIVVGEGITFYYEHGRHMSKAQATAIYEDTKRAALSFAREFTSRIRRRDR
jgi:uncharacterized protein (DUF697 family)